MDEHDWAAFDQLTTDDVEADVGLGMRQGREALVEVMRQFLEVCGATQHMLGNVLVDVDGDRASSQAYVADIHVGRDDKSSLTFRTLGIYRDQWRKIDGRWLICRRVKDNRQTIGSMDVFSPE
jgi:hypothetical protein